MCKFTYSRFPKLARTYFSLFPFKKKTNKKQQQTTETKPLTPKLFK